MVGQAKTKIRVNILPALKSNQLILQEKRTPKAVKIQVKINSYINNFRLLYALHRVCHARW
ncbi:MAG: hypothetical protein ACOYL3_08015, partial [Desulfuromonadaceae bacterium]